TTYAFATMAAAFIAGLAIGSAAGARAARRSALPAGGLAAMLTMSSVSAAVAADAAATRLPLIGATQGPEPHLSFAHPFVTQAAGTAFVLLPMTLALGATFPLALAVASGGTSTTGADAARVYTANTIGAIAGALVAGFALVPWLGLQATFRATAVTGAVGGALCLLAASRGRSTPRFAVLRTLSPAIVAIAAVAVIVLLPPWDRDLLASGAYKYAP